MAYDNNQTDQPLPNGDENKRKSESFLPRFFRTTANKKFLNSTLDQLIQPGVVEKLNGYIGRETAKAFTASDSYVGDVSAERANYQLEPASVVKDNIGNVTFYKDYNDYMNQLGNFNLINKNHSTINAQEYYAWNPHIDWDKFTNFREYYWLPLGPQTIGIAGTTIDVESTYTIRTADNIDNNAYVFSPDGLTQNPTITLYRGVTYKFDIDTPNLPFTIKTKKTLDEGFDLDSSSILVLEGVSVQGLEKGVSTLQLGADTPDTLYYMSANDLNAAGTIIIKDIAEATFIDVDSEVVGKRFYKSSNGISLSNGMKVEFTGQVEPVKYANESFYVEGVGDKIKLIAESDLNVPTAFTEDIDVEFDAQGFDRLPYSKAIGYPEDKDYFVINRASNDGNLWSRYNRWFHKSVIESSAQANNQPIDINQLARAKRPIIEFEPNLKLHEFGTKSKKDADLVDDFTTDVFSTIEGSPGYNIDGVDIVDGMRILFTADTDPLVTGKIFDVKFINFTSGATTNRQIHLTEATDSTPVENEVVLISAGTSYKGKLLYYTNNSWKRTQDKTSANQAPLFDIFDENGNSYSDTSVYESTTFTGNKIFSYKQGTGTADSEIGIPITYRKISNVGDIVFDFNLVQDTITYTADNNAFSKATDTGFLRKYSDLTAFETLTGWKKVTENSEQVVIQQIIYDNTINDFEIDVYDNSGSLTDLWVRVYRNNVLQFKDVDYTINTNIQGNAQVTFNNTLVLDDVILIKTRSAATKNDNGYYEIPVALERNPKNENLTEFTLGAVNDHVSTIVEQSDEFSGVYPGVSNLRDVGNVTALGRRFLQHSVPLNLPLYHSTDNNSNIVKSIEYASKEYSVFKRLFLQKAEDLGFQGAIKDHVDKILQDINKDKTKSQPFFFSDMVPIGATKKTTRIIDDVDDLYFPLSSMFSLTSASRKAVQIYINGVQLVHNKDYTFNSEGYALITATKQQDDVVDIYEYETTNGSYIPPTPTKLGLYPAYEPVKYTDNTYVESQQVIQGHDGSKIIAFNDYRDDLLLELERRIYNNIKVSYDPTLFDIHSLVGSDFRNTGVTKSFIDKTILGDFISWSKFIDQDYTLHNFFERTNRFTFNYTGSQNKQDVLLPGFWREVYKQAFDTDRPHTHPWEMIGFSVKPTWWETQYGPAPYTKENTLLWQDLEDGVVREPNKKFKVLNNYKRPGLTGHIPADSNGNLLSPLDAGYVKFFDPTFIDQSFIFGDGSPVESAWRSSSQYPFSIVKAFAINKPAQLFATGFDRINQVKNIADEIVYKPTQKRFQLKDIVFPNTSEDTTQVYTSGIVNYISNYMSTSVLDLYKEYKENITTINNQLGYKLSGFTDKEKFKLILDSRTPTNQGNVFVPFENYKIFLNTSSPTKIVSYSGVIVERRSDGYVVKGYDNQTSSFTYYQTVSTQRDPSINIGGISESFLIWDTNKNYVAGANVEYQGSYYRVKEAHTSTGSFDNTKFAKLASLPLIGGRNAFVRKQFNKNVVLTADYGKIFTKIQDVVDFLLGYGEYLKDQGFVFDYYEGEEKVLTDWRHSVNEFLFWTTQKWGEGSVITLSPASKQIKFVSQYNMVANVFGGEFGYTLLQSDGTPLVEEFSSVGRSPNEFILTPKNTAEGIFAIKLPLIQKEHVLLIDNKTVFGDIIYDTQPGYRQERIKVLGYITQDWDGSLNIPGFVYDDATVTNWQQWTDYAIGDIVKYKEFYYSAIKKLSGKENFDAQDWHRLDDKPEAGLYTNFDYKVNQFSDFYDLDSDNFDTEQQKVAQHLIGYQKRQYLENIVNDDVSQYKFYQGMLQDKGTKNALTKLFDVLSSADKDSLEFYEEWAIKDGQYGAAEGFEEFELLLDESKFRLSPQPIELVNSTTGNETDLVYRILPYEVYQKTKNYNHQPFPALNVNKSYIKDAGYVNQADVRGIATTYSNLADYNISDIKRGQYVWVGNDNLNWNVYKHVDTDYIVESIEAGSTEFNITLTTNVTDIIVDDVIGMSNVGNTTLDKFYIVSKVDKNVITLVTSSAVQEIAECKGNITKFLSVRSASIPDANTVLQKNLDEGDLHWIDNFNGNWSVIKNTNNFTEQLKVQKDSSAVDLSYATSMAVDSRNTTLVVGAPDENDGKVYIYTRASDSINFVQSQVIEPVKYGNDLERFGAGLDISPDGDFIIVGSPDASNVKTKYEGSFVATDPYPKGSIVSSNQQLWRSVVDIQPQVANVVYNSFDSVTDVIDQLNVENLNTVDIPMLLTGNYAIDTVTNQYAFQNVATDHILIRAPLDIYRGIGLNDTVKLAWNSITYSNQSLAALAQQAPFAGSFPSITEAYLDAGHVVQKKIDVILYINSSTNLVELNDIVQTETGSGTVDYVYNEGAELVIYLKDVNGSFNSSDSLFRNDGDFIGQYEKQGPTDSLDTSTELGGFLYITAPSYTPTSATTNKDQGRGLIFADVIRPSESSNRYYYNILDFDSAVLDSQNTFNSYIRVLSSQGLPGAFGNNSPILSDLYVVRAPKPVTDVVNQGDTINFYVNQLPQYGTGIIKDITALNLTTTITNKLQTIYDVWDGYINFDFTKFDASGNPFEPKVGQSVEDKTTGATGVVAYYQRDGLNATVFVKSVTGVWSKGDDYGQNAEIEFKLIPGDPSPTYQADRIIGQVQFVSLGLPADNIGKMLVFQNADNLSVPAGIDYITDAEYWFYQQDNVNGIPRPANAPSAINNEWEQTYKIPTDITGTASGLTNEGIYAIYSKTTFGRYDLINSYTVPEKATNYKLGSSIKITKNNNLYRGMIGAAGNGTTSLPGKIYFIKKGTENNLSYNWDYAKNKKFKGTFNESLNYFTDDIVYIDAGSGVLYVAKTNVAPGAFDANDWTSTDDLVDYVGFIPNNTGLSVVNDSSVGDTVLDQDGLVEFGSEFDVANSGEVLITNAMYNDSTNKVVVYRANNGHFERSQEIDAPDITSGFGHALALSNDGTVIAISAPYNDDYKADQGVIYIYKQVNGVFEIAQTLKSPNNEQGEKFGWRLDFDGDQLFVSAKDADMATKTIFDSGATILDQGFTAFNTINDNAGVVYVYEKVKQDLIFAQTIQIPSTELVDPNINYFGNNILARNNHFYVGLPNRVDGTRLGNVIDFKNNRNENIWQIHRSNKPTVDLNKIKKMFLYNTKDNELLTYIDYIDPIQGKVAGIAEQDLTYKTYYDPALYDLSSTGQVIDPTNSWGEKHVGEVWWDLTNAKFFNPYQGDVVFSTQNWSKIFQGNRIDVYEWVESPVIPSEWDAQADTENGFAKGFSGTSLYGDATYSTRKIYDGVAKIFKTNYYFWVKNKKTIPDVEFRNTSIFDIADYIQDPIAKGYTFAALISPSQFVLYNAEKYIKGTEVALSTQYWTIPNQTQNIHNQYQIISEGLETSQPNNDIVRKWFDSLSGYDEQDRIVPDPYLSPKQKYGALNKPRQSWFKNRYEALKQFIERTNLVLSENLIVDDKIITSLNKNDPEPTVVSNLYDVKIDTLDDLGFVGVAKASQAVLTPVVVNGKITNVLITDPGRGYRNAPLVTVTGLGSGAVLQTTIDALGKVSSVTILESGENYSDNVILTVRPFTVLVSSDNTILGKWALYERDTVARTWNRVKSQAYDTKLFWDYKDWYATGYSEVTDIDYLIDNAYELTQLEAGISNVVKISNIGSGGWLLLEKIDNRDTEDYTINYKTIGRQNGTIKFNETLYDSEAAFTGFDTISFDTKIFDSEPRTELRIILNTIKDNLFIDDLQVKFNELFFASLRYAFSEQTYIDWAFKTSFIKAKHNVGSLRKDITFNNDSLPSYEAYIKEVKPFGTKIREYLSAYEGLDNTQTVVTDFDLPASYSAVEGKIVPQNVKVQSNTLVGTNADIETYPNKNWLDNSSYKVVKVNVVNQGSGYFSPPVLKVSGGGGSGVELETTIGTNGKVTGVKIVNAGSGFYSAPTIESLDNISDTGEKATYSIQIGDSPVRGLHTSVKFDRTTGTYVYTNLNKSETFVASGSKFEYDLSWPMDLDKSNIKVYVNNVEALDSEYTFTNKLDVSKGYDRYFGQISFVNLPELNKTILIEYKLSSDIMQAQDRINNFIPKNGNYVTDLKQLMTGLDYGGVEVKSFEFEQGRGFDSGGDTWDSYDETFEDEIFELDGSTISLDLAAPLANATVYNVYLNGVRVDDANFGTAEPVTNPNARTQSITGDGTTQIVFLDNDGLNINGEGAAADAEYNNGAISNVTGDGSDFFKREVTTNGVRIMGAGTVGGQTAVPDAWLEKVARMFELFTDPNGAGINEAFQRNLIKTLSGDTGTYHAGLSTIQRVARGAGADYTPNFLTDAGVISWNLTNLFDTHVQNDMVWYLNSTGDGYGDGDIDAQEVIEHVFHTLHMHGLPADDIKLYQFLAADWQSGDLYAAMEEAFDAGKWDPSGYQSPADDWKTNSDAFEVAAKEYLFLLNFAMFEYTELWDGGSLAPEWTDDMRTQAGILANNPLGYAFHNTYIAPVISKPSLATIRSIFQDGNTPAQDDPTLAGASGYVVDVIGSSDGVGAGDIITIRKSTSDGTYLPEPNSYDTLIKGGALNYSTATGISAADINIDGDGFVTPTTSAGPEELVPGQVIDTLDIKVYERPSDGSSKITSRNYTGDGTTTVFNFGAEVIQQDSLFVKINYAIIASTEYTIDYNAKTITFNTAPIVGSKIHLAVLGVSGTKIIDIDNFVADGSTARFLTNVRFADNLQSVITLDGQKLENVVVKSRKPDGISGNALIKFATPPAAGSVINFAFFEGGDVQNYSEVGIQNFTLDGSTTSYTLTTTPFTATPTPWQTIVKVNDIILNAGYTQKFTMAAATREYQLDNFQIPPGSVNNKGLQVFINGKKLTYLKDWTFTGASSSAGSSIVRIKTAVGHSTGDILDVYLVNDGQYAFGYIDANGEFVDTPGTIYLDSAYNENDVLTVYQFSNHDSQRFERQQLDVISRVTLTPNTDDWYKFNHLTAGLIELPTPAIDAEYVWITINGQLLLPSIQYQVTDNKKYVKINIPVAQNDVIELIHFAEAQSVNKYGWSQFKDMLNRTHYKRLDDTAGIQLVTDLNWYDQKITISDGSTLPIPDATSSVPGVIFIGGERIEYFVRNDNVLSQLRRGTLGTGVKDTHIEGTTVFNSGLTSVMPYKDETLTTQFTADGTSSTYTLDFVASSINEFEVFVGGKRLRKNAISSYVSLNPTYQDSPEGDVTLPAEFSVNGSTLTLTTTPTENVKVTVVRRSGIIWTNPGTQLSKADSDIARFLRDSTVDLPR